MTLNRLILLDAREIAEAAWRDFATERDLHGLGRRPVGSSLAVVDTIWEG